MLKLPKPSALYWDVYALRASTIRRNLPPRLPDALPDVAAFWAERQVATGPLPDLSALLHVLEENEAGTIYQFTFPSRVVSPDAANNLVPGRYYVPAHPKEANAAPFLLLLHANGVQDWEREAWFARRLMQRGCRVAHIILPYQFLRRPLRLNFGATVLTSDLPHTLEALGQAVCDAADVLRWARAQGVGRVLIAGWSLGGLVSALVATQVPLDGALLVEPAINLAWEMNRPGVFGWRARQKLRQAGISQAMLESFLAPVLPINLKPQVPLDKLRFLVARYDLVVGYQPILEFWRAWGQPALNVQATSHVSLLYTPALIAELEHLAE